MICTITTLQKPRHEDFHYCLECKREVSHTVKWDGNKKYYTCQNCGFEIWVYIEPWGPKGFEDARYHNAESS